MCGKDALDKAIIGGCHQVLIPSVVHACIRAPPCAPRHSTGVVLWPGANSSDVFGHYHRVHLHQLVLHAEGLNPSRCATSQCQGGGASEGGPHPLSASLLKICRRLRRQRGALRSNAAAAHVGGRCVSACVKAQAAARRQGGRRRGGGPVPGPRW